MTRSSILPRALWLALALLGACGDDDTTPTQVLLILDADDVIREEASSVRISAYASEGAFAPPRDASALVEERDWEVTGSTDWPIRVLLEPRRFPDGRYRIVASAEAGSMGTVETQVISGYVAGELRIVHMRLHAACIDAEACGATNQRCGASGMCEDAEIPPDELECPDGPCGERDAGGPDGGPRDGGTDGGSVDAGSCERSEDCEGGATCVGGRCVPPDAGVPDGGVDGGPPPPPEGPTTIDYALPAAAPPIPSTEGLEVLGAAPRGADGFVVVGSVGDSLRDAFAMRVVGGLHAWTVRFGGAQSDRLYSVATNGTETLAVGLIRRVGSPNHNDVLLVPVSDDSVGDAVVLGTTGDEHLFGVIPGGEVADFVGFGVCGSDGSRDGLVMGIEVDGSSARASWVRCYDLGGDEYFSSGVVVGRQIVAIGTEEPGAPADPGRAIVARVPSPEAESMLPIALRSRELGSRAYTATLDPGPNHVVIGAALGTGGSRPAVLRLNANDLDYRSATALPIDAVAPTQLVVEGPNVTVVGIRNVGGIYRPFVGRLADGFSWVEYANVRVASFLPTPFVEVGGVSRVVGEGNRAVVDMPFTRTPAASCAGPRAAGSLEFLSNELESVINITRRTPSFVIASPSITRTSLAPLARAECP